MLVPDNVARYLAMPFPSTHHYVSVIGDSYNAAEAWQFGFRLTDGGLSNEVTALAIADDVEAFWRGTAPWVAGTSWFPFTTHRLVELKVARLGVDGLYPPDEVAYSHFYLPPIAGVTAPWDGTVPQATISATLLTAKPRGLASKGRIYLPPCQRMSVDGSGLMAEANALAVANAVNLLVTTINANAEVGNVAIFSRGRREATFNPVTEKIEYTYPNPGAVENVTGVKVGRVVDTQRRRRRQMAEQYQSDTN